MSSSDNPSEKYSLPASPLVLAKGRTAMLSSEVFTDWPNPFSNSSVWRLKKTQGHAMFYLALAEVMQLCRPRPILREILRHSLGEQNVSLFAAIHHALCHVDPSAGNVRATTHVGNFTHRSAITAISPAVDFGGGSIFQLANF
jgi:hypothetical protein